MRLTLSQSLFWSTLLLFLLSGCAGASSQPSPTHTGTTPIPTFSPTPTFSPLPTFPSIPTFPPMPTGTSLPFLPNNHAPFQATFVERAPLTTCPPSSEPADLCWNVSGAGNSIPYGQITFTSFDINFRVPGGDQPPDYCEPPTRRGSIVIGTDKIMFAASGTWCLSLVYFAYKVTGGAGRFLHAHGTGSIFIPDPNHNVLEY